VKRRRSGGLDDDDSLVAEIRVFLDSYAEHDPDCSAFNASGASVFDPDGCECGLNVRREQLLSRLSERLRDRPPYA